MDTTKDVESCIDQAPAKAREEVTEAAVDQIADEELLKGTVTPPMKLLIYQTNEKRRLRPEIRTLGIQDSA